MEFIHSVLAQYETVTAGTVVTYDLPVNPLSFILLTLRFQQDQADVQLDWDDVDAMLSKVEVLYKGSAIQSYNGSDLEALDAKLLGYVPAIHNRYGDDDDYTYFTFLVPLGRKVYDPNECFPRSIRGELHLQITYASSFTDIDGVKACIETVELPEATPMREVLLRGY